MMQVCCCWETVRLQMKLMKQAHMQLFIKTELNKAIHYAEQFDFFSLHSSRGWWLMIHCSHRRQKWVRWNSAIMISITRLKMMYVCHTLCSRYYEAISNKKISTKKAKSPNQLQVPIQQLQLCESVCMGRTFRFSTGLHQLCVNSNSVEIQFKCVVR